MQHKCNNCNLPIKETGRLKKHNFGKRIIWLCSDCNAQKKIKEKTYSG